MMSMARLAAAAALAATLALPATLPPVAAAQRQARDWTAVISRTPAGAFVMGNPAAPVKIVEYLSYTCSHCAAFSAEGLGPLKATYIRGGRVSIEFRHALRDPYDFIAALLARCGGPTAYPAASEAIFAGQPDWLQRAATVEPTPGQSRSKTAQSVGLDAIVRARGISDARQAACLANPAEERVLGAMAEEAWQQRHIPGTPAFLINGTLVDHAATWSALEPAIRAALVRAR